MVTGVTPLGWHRQHAQLLCADGSSPALRHVLQVDCMLPVCCCVSTMFLPRPRLHLLLTPPPPTPPHYTRSPRFRHVHPAPLYPPADPHTQKALSVTQLYPNLVVREMVERWLETGDATAEAQEQAAGHTSTRSSSSSSAAGHTTACGGGSSGGSRLQGQLQRQDSTSDPLSSFGVSSGSSTDSDS